MEEVTAPRTGSAYVLQRLDVNGAVSCILRVCGSFFGVCVCVTPMRSRGAGASVIPLNQAEDFLYALPLYAKLFMVPANFILDVYMFIKR